MTTEDMIMLSGLIQQFCDSITAAVPAPIGDLVSQFCGLFAGLFASFGL